METKEKNPKYSVSEKIWKRGRLVRLERVGGKLLSSSVWGTTGLQSLPKAAFYLQDRDRLQAEKVLVCGFFRCTFVPVCVK